MNKEKWSFVNEALNVRKAADQLRKLRAVEPAEKPGFVVVDGEELINFCSNDYLGLSHHPLLKERSQLYLNKFGAGSTASRLVSGNLIIHKELEEKFADVLSLESVLLFNSGFQLNTTVISSLANRNSLILADKKVHNSLLQGALLSRASFKRFEHNESDDLQQILKDINKDDYNRILILTETVFSMDGDCNDLDSLEKIASESGAILYSDDAHALGVLGKNGLGLNYERNGVDLSIGTLGKSFGSFGAFIGCTEQVREYLINMCPGFIYTTALPPAVIGALDAALDLIPEMNSEREGLFSLINYFRNSIKQLGFETIDSDSQIVPVIIGSEKDTMDLSKYLYDKGFWISAIRPPTVEKGKSRLRITITVDHKREQVDKLLNSLSQWNKRDG